MIKKLSIIAVCIMFSATLLSANTGRANSEMIIAHHHKQNIDRIDKQDSKCNKDCKQQNCKKADKCECNDNCPKKNKKDKRGQK